MPTAAKLVAALSFALIAYIAAELFIPVLPEVTPVQYFSAINAIIGLFVGWWVMGPNVGKSLLAAARRGLATSVILLFWADVAFSLRDMLINSTKRAYKTPTKAILAVFDNLVEFLLLAMSPPVVIVLAAGGVLAGVFVELTSRRWR